MDRLAVLGAVAVLVEESLALLLSVAVLLNLVLVGAEVERRIGYIEVSLLYNLRHKAVEESHNERVDVRTIDIGIGHDDNLVVTQLVDVGLLVFLALDAETHTDTLYDVHNRLRLEHLVPHNLLHVKNLTAQRQYSLSISVASLLGRATTPKTLDEEYITLHGISLKIIDTAGIRETKDIVEKIGVDRAREMAQKADLILYVVDSSVPLDENDEEIMEMLTGKKASILYNKTDLQPEIQPEILKEKTGHPVIPISAKEEKGITELEEQIKDMFFGGEISFNDEVYITNARHKAALEEADRSLDLGRNSIEMGMPEDFFSIDLMNAYENLGKILGESVGEDLVNEIFSKFCMGK